MTLRIPLTLLYFLVILVTGLCSPLVALALDSTHMKAKVPELRKMASDNDVQAQTAMGWAYYFGTQVKPDSEKSLKWFQRAADNGSSEAQFQLGVAYMSGSAGKVDPDTSRHWFEKSLSSGNPDAGVFLGAIYAEGLGVRKDTEISQRYYDQARAVYEDRAQKDDYYANSVLAGLYFYGYGVHADEKKFQYYTAENDRTFELDKNKEYYQASLNNELAVNYFLGRGLQKNPDKAFRLNQLPAVKNWEFAQTVLGYFYIRGVGTAQDHKKALDWLLRASVQGDGVASYIIASQYDGSGIAADAEKSKIFYKRAEDQLTKELDSANAAPSAYHLALIYKFGLGTEANPKKATALFNQACNKSFYSDCPDLSDTFVNKNQYFMEGLFTQKKLLETSK